jgi:LytS/YehU family sensor histidine kinase
MLADAALLLQPLVENCIRHGLEPKVEGGRITVRAEQDGGQLLLTVRDTGVGLSGNAALPAAAAAPGADAVQRSHYGTRHVAGRLATLYGAQASFTLRPAPDGDSGTLAEVRLPLHAGLAEEDARGMLARAGFGAVRSRQHLFAKSPYPGGVPFFVVSAQRAG